MGMVGGLVIIILSVLFGLLTILTILIVLRTHRLVIRSPDSNRVLGYYLCKIVTDKKDGSRWWQTIFLHKSLRLPEPPDKVVSVNRRGKSFVEVYQLGKDEYAYIQPQKLKNTDKVLSDGQTIGEVFKPFSVVPRQVIINKFIQSEKLRQHNWLKENAMNLVCVGTMALIIVMGMVYSGEIFQGINSVQGGASGMINDASKMLQSFKTGAKDLSPDSLAGVVQQGTEEPPE